MYVNTRDAVAHIAKKGLRYSPTTLAKLRCVGGGPKFRKLGRRVLYETHALDSWIEDRLSDELSSTSELA